MSVLSTSFKFGRVASIPLNSVVFFVNGIANQQLLQNQKVTK